MAVRIDYANSTNTTQSITDNFGNTFTAKIDELYITGGGYVNRAFKGVSRDSSLGWEEPVWGGELNRSKNFILANIDSTDFGLVARCEISFKYMNTEDYKALCKIAKQRLCYVTYYNKQIGGWVVGQEMAFTGNEVSKLYTYGEKYLGVFDITIKLVATNRDREDLVKSTFSISYNANGGSGTIATQSNNRWGALVKLGTTGFTRSGYTLTGWNTNANGTGDAYVLGQEVTIFSNLTLYAQWRQN